VFRDGDKWGRDPPRSTHHRQVPTAPDCRFTECIPSRTCTPGTTLPIHPSIHPSIYLSIYLITCISCLWWSVTAFKLRSSQHLQALLQRNSRTGCDNHACIASRLLPKARDLRQSPSCGCSIQMLLLPRGAPQGAALRCDLHSNQTNESSSP